MHFERNICHSQGSKCIPRRTFIIAKDLIESTLWTKCILKGMFTKFNVSILGIMILFMETHKCVIIVMQVGADNMDGHKSTLGHFYLLEKFNGVMVLLVGIARNNLYYYVIKKSWMYGNFINNKTSNVVFLIFWEH